MQSEREREREILTKKTLPDPASSLGRSAGHRSTRLGSLHSCPGSHGPCPGIPDRCPGIPCPDILGPGIHYCRGACSSDPRCSF